ncbi:MAG: glycosyltransferase, partial [Burkholderiales bacterium]
IETVQDAGWRGVLKRLEYRRLFLKWAGRIEGVLAIGHRTPAWVVARGLAADHVVPFAYFLPRETKLMECTNIRSGPFRFAFIGRFIRLKRLDLLILALATLKRSDLELVVIGSGPLEVELRDSANAALVGRVHWIGRLQLRDVPRALAETDCLVLPSRYDGWGAVVSEALMVGTPAICSDRCGAAGAVQASGHGGVFCSGDVSSLRDQIARMLDRGRLSPAERGGLAKWAECLGSDTGARYLRAVLDAQQQQIKRPMPPWDKANREVRKCSV